MTRSDLDVKWEKWREHVVDYGFTSHAQNMLSALIADERAASDLQAQAQAIRFAALDVNGYEPWSASTGLNKLADDVEAGKVKVP